MLLQTNSYIVPKDKRTEHARLVARFKQVLARIGCDHFEAYEQVGSNWSPEATGRFVQIMRFRDRKQQQAVQAAERSDPAAQALIKEFCELINFPYQQQQGLFAVGFYSALLPASGSTRVPPPAQAPESSLGRGAAAVEDDNASHVAENGESVEPAPGPAAPAAGDSPIADQDDEVPLAEDDANVRDASDITPGGGSRPDRAVEA
jgi:hypothetical protein